MSTSSDSTMGTSGLGFSFGILLAISGTHLINDMMQSVLLALYPLLQGEFSLSFVQIGLITVAFQCSASLLQPLIGLYTDKRPLPWLLPAGMGFTVAGLMCRQLPLDPVGSCADRSGVGGVPSVVFTYCPYGICWQAWPGPVYFPGRRNHGISGRPVAGSSFHRALRAAWRSLGNPVDFSGCCHPNRQQPLACSQS